MFRNQVASSASCVSQLAGWACLERGFSVFLDVNACLKLFQVVFRRFLAWEKSMLLEVVFLKWRHPAKMLLIFVDVDGAECLD